MRPAEPHDTLEKLLDLFLEENRHLNLSALRSREQCRIGNVLDSLTLLDILPSLFVVKKEHPVIVDIGTGGGFPLLPLAIALPDARFCGIDATKKKTDAIMRIAEALSLQNVAVLNGRAEELGRHPELREKCDLVTARAVAPIATLLEYCVPFLRVGGKCVLWKSMHIADELRQSANAVTLLKASLKMTHTYRLPGGFGERQLLVYEKQEPTDPRYPRDVGVPKKNPL